MDEFLEQFLIEGHELVQQASDDLLALERDPADAARTASVFRAVHTLKGSVALFDFASMGRVLHAAENLLGAVRDGRLDVDGALIDALLNCIGVCEEWIGEIARTGGLPDNADARGAHLEATLRAPLRAGDEQVLAPAMAKLEWLPPLLAIESDAMAKAQALGLSVTALRFLPHADCFFLGIDPMALVRSIPDLIALRLALREPWSAESFETFTCNLAIEVLSTGPAEQLRHIFRLVADQTTIVEAIALDTAAAAPAERMPRHAEHDASRTLRVDANRIDALLDLVGELIVAKNGLAHLVAQAAGSNQSLARALDAKQSEIERLVGGLHRAVMGVRMTPLARTFRRFPRLVRETAARLGKPVAFEMHGEEVEADRSIVDRLFEPLLHVLRNAVDHGLEAAEARAAAGKPPLGRVRLDAQRDGDQIVISVSDDGGGINPVKLRHAAKARNLMSDAAIDALDDVAVTNLVFAPGFSTATLVTDISGRGVGMDAVRMAVEAMGGRVVLTSEPGSGAKVSLTLPRAVVITAVMTVQVGEERFGIPIDVVAGIARIPADRILPIRSGEAFVLHDRTIPLLRLAALLGRPQEPRLNSHAKVLITVCGDQHIGIEVDSFADRTDVLLRPLTGLLSGMPGVLGAALLGDGQVLIVLDLPELIG